ncbi:MAG TPA: MerR family transcriptional regulator [Streptosporangiaceae bacterium]|nr:MerR family transcriptional regulator [Streptosporangiaceae bacterium]
MSAQPARGYLGISEVLAQLRADFPDISVSKIRFLETEGLVTPARSAAGYRRFCGQDVDRLRFILTAQRDQYLPLRVIRERLARLDQHAADTAESAGWRDPAAAGPAAAAAIGATAGTAGHRGARSGESAAGAGRGYPEGTATADDGASQPVSRRELVEGAGISEALLTELETFGLVRRIGRHYSAEALEVARTAAALAAFGVEARHLRAVRAAAERETAMIESLVAPILRQRGPGARELAGRTARDCAALVLRLHCALVEGTLAEAGLPAGRLGQAAQARSAEFADGEPRALERGVEGASA